MALAENLVKITCTGRKLDSIDVHCALTENLVKICTGRKLDSFDVHCGTDGKIYYRSALVENLTILMCTMALAENLVKIFCSG